MRTKVLLGLAALAVGLSTSVAQNVYSLNVVGYVNKTVAANHWYLWSNPLKATNNTSATVLAGLSGAATGWDNALLYGWNGGFSDVDTFVGALGQWLPGTTDLTPGKGFFFFAPQAGTVTFVGEVGTTNSFALPTGWSIVGSTFPATNSLVAIGLLGQDNGSGKNDLVYRYGATGYGEVDTFVAGAGWLGTGPDGNGPVLDVGEAVFYDNAQTAAVNWVKSFTIQ